MLYFSEMRGFYCELYIQGVNVTYNRYKLNRQTDRRITLLY